MFPAPDQKAIRIARLLAEDVLPFFGCPESLLSDRGTNLLALVMQDVCQLLGTTKLNTTAYHRWHVGTHEPNAQVNATDSCCKIWLPWDRYLPGILCTYRNTAHELTKEKPSFLLYEVDCRSPTEVALLPTDQLGLTEISDYREEFILSHESLQSVLSKQLNSSTNSSMTGNQDHSLSSLVIGF